MASARDKAAPRRSRALAPGPARRPDGAAPGRSGLAELQRAAGNRIVVGLLGGDRAAGPSLSRRVLKATDGNGPVADLEDSSIGGDEKARADGALKLVDAGTAFDAHPYVEDRTTANGGKVPNSVKKNMKWAWAHRNVEGHLPGVKGAGGYMEYYICSGADQKGAPTDWERLVVSAGTGDVFHTNTHYGNHGTPAFTHYRAK